MGPLKAVSGTEGSLASERRGLLREEAKAQQNCEDVHKTTCLQQMTTSLESLQNVFSLV